MSPDASPWAGWINAETYDRFVLVRRAAPGLSAGDALDALAQARRRTDPAQPVEVPWIYWQARR